MADNSEPAPSKKKRYCVKFNDLLRNIGQVKVLLYVLCVEAISVLHMEEKMISIDTRTPQSIRDMLILRNNKNKLTDVGASSVTSNLDQKVIKVCFFLVFWLNMSSLWLLQITLLNYSETCFQILK